MYACIPEIGGGFFEVVHAFNDQARISSDLPPPLSAKEPEPHCQGSGPMWIMRRLTVGGALA
jgi:hypothetical protein